MDNPKYLSFINPATGQSFGQVAMHTPAQVQQALAELRPAARVWAAKPVRERVRILRKFQEVVIDSLDEITAVMNQDCGKSRQDALLEVFITVDVLREYLKHAPAWLRREQISSGLYVFKRCYTEQRPYGVVSVIAPWNYPFALSMPPVLAALLAGNAVLLKPSEVTAATGVMMEKLFQQVPELAPFVRVVHGDGSVGAAMLEAGPDFVFLTGSTGTGKKVLQAASEHLIPVTCELGGKDAMIVLEDADLPAAAHWGAWGAFFNTGQTCMSVERVYVVASVYDEFVRLAVEETQQLKYGFTTELESPYYLGPVTDPRQVKIIERHLGDAVAKGARILTGGRRTDMFIEPTVLVDVDHSMLVMQEETFGPLMPIMKVKNEAEAIRMANDSVFGLGASIWSRDIPRAERVAHQLEAGTALINDVIAQFAVPLLPFGGVKQSGYGRTHGREGLLQFTQPYSYVLGNPPFALDVATVARKPGNYRTVASIMHLVFGVNSRQRLKPVSDLMAEGSGHRAARPTLLGLGLAAGAFSALAGLVLSRRKRVG